jgi:hypothetical protein
VSIVIPKELRNFGFTELTLVDLNDMDVDRMLPQLWELIVKQGRLSSAPQGAEEYERHLDSLAADPRLSGFDDAQGTRVLDGWLRSSIVQMGAKGRDKSGTQLLYIRPLTIASYRASLPKVRRNRNADILVYKLLLEEMGRRGVESPEKNLRMKLQGAVGTGITIGIDGDWMPSYDGTSEIDVNALLSLYFLDRFPDMRGPKPPRYDYAGSAVPSATRGLAIDLLDFLATYGGRLPAAAFVDRFAALISIRLFQLPPRVARVARHVLTTGEASADMRDGYAPNPLELYCDFTRVRGSASDELSRQCVQRDMEITRGFLHDRLLLRSLHEALDMLDDEDYGARIKALPVSDRLVEMVGLRQDPGIGAFATIRMQSIKAETEKAGDTEEDLELIATIRKAKMPAVDRLTALLVEGIGETGLKNQVKWFWNTGGIQKPYGLLTGSVQSRRSWRYAPSDDLLNALLLTCFTQRNDPRPKTQMTIRELLQVMEARFGILVDRPPTDFDSADNRAAAAANLEAFKRRLQLLGCFDGLSDDFSAQQVRNPVEAV